LALVFRIGADFFARLLKHLLKVWESLKELRVFLELRFNEFAIGNAFGVSSACGESRHTDSVFGSCKNESSLAIDGTRLG